MSVETAISGVGECQPAHAAPSDVDSVFPKRGGIGEIALSTVQTSLWVVALLFSAATLDSHLIAPELPAELVPREEWDARLAGVDDLSSAVALVRIEAANGSREALAETADRFVRQRFVHGYSNFTPRQDWVGWTAGKLVWDDLSVPVIADDILQFREGACSQQAIVFIAIMQSLGFETRAVGLTKTGHYLAAANVSGEWRVFDANKEIAKSSFPLSSLLSASPEVLRLYPQLDVKADADGGHITLSDPNAPLAPQAAAFQTLTKLSSDYGWMVLLVLASSMHLAPFLYQKHLLKGEGQSSSLGRTSFWASDTSLPYTNTTYSKKVQSPEFVGGRTTASIERELRRRNPDARVSRIGEDSFVTEGRGFHGIYNGPRDTDLIKAKRSHTGTEF